MLYKVAHNAIRATEIAREFWGDGIPDAPPIAHSQKVLQWLLDAAVWTTVHAAIGGGVALFYLSRSDIKVYYTLREDEWGSEIVCVLTFEF